MTDRSNECVVCDGMMDSYNATDQLVSESMASDNLAEKCTDK